MDQAQTSAATAYDVGFLYAPFLFVESIVVSAARLYTDHSSWIPALAFFFDISELLHLSVWPFDRL
jgi:hypothetical protein